MATKTLSKSHSSFISHSMKQYSRYLLEAIVDFSRTGTTTLAVNDVLQAVAIPANCRVNAVVCNVLTVEGAARNYAVMDGAAAYDPANCYISTTTANTLGATHSAIVLSADATPVVVGLTTGKFFTAAGTVNVQAVTAGGLTTCKLKITVDVTDYN